MTQQTDNRPAPRPPSPLARRLAVTILVPLVIVVVGTFLVLRQFNPNRYAPALVTALEQITGRPVILSGPVSIRWSLTPAIETGRIAIENPPGFPDPDVLTLAGLRADIALLPLLSHRVNIVKLVLIQPRLTLERLPGGAADWDFSTAAGGMPFRHARMKVALEAVEVQDGLIRIASGGRTAAVIHITRLTGTAASLSAPLHLDAEAEIGATPFRVAGMLGPVERFSGIGAGPWPVNLDLAMAGARLAVNGTLAHPRDGRGYDLAVMLTIPALDALGQALPPALTAGLPLPPLRDITATADIEDRSAPLPAVTGLTVTAGKSDLSALRPGLVLNGLAISIPALDQPAVIMADGTSPSGDFKLQARFGALQTLLAPAWQPAGAPPASFPVTVTAQLADATASVTGAIATPQTLSGVALAVTAGIPDLSALSAIAGTPLPGWKHIALQANLIDPGGAGLYHAAALDDLTATMDNAAFGGAATLFLTPRPKLQLALNVTQANLDALLAALPPPAPPTAPAPLSPPTGTTTVIPATPLPLGFLSWGDADLQLAADNVTWNGASYTALQAGAVLAGHKLTIGPLTAEIPGGEITASASLDASGPQPAASLTVKAPALAIGPLVKLLGLPGTGEGNLQLQLSASSTGGTLQAMAANLNGQLGLASVNDQLSAALLDRLFGPLETAAGLPPATSLPAFVRCAGLAVSAAQGVATLTAFGIDSNPLLLQATGSVNLGQERYDLRFQPFNGAPVLLGGSFAQPTLTAAPAPLTPAPLTSAPPAAPPAAAPPRPDICPATLALARLGQHGPAAPPPATTATPVPPGGNAPKNLLNSLLGP